MDHIKTILARFFALVGSALGIFENFLKGLSEHAVNPYKVIAIAIAVAIAGDAIMVGKLTTISFVIDHFKAFVEIVAANVVASAIVAVVVALLITRK